MKSPILLLSFLGIIGTVGGTGIADADPTTTVYAKLGLNNGDTLKTINGFDLTSADKALEVYTKVREATSIEVEIERRGKSVTLSYSIR